MDHPLRRAFAAKRISQREAADWLQVDPKTVERWCKGRLPHPRIRVALSSLTGWPEHDLWPNYTPVTRRSSRHNESIVTGLRWSQISDETWHQLFNRAQHYIDILTESTLFITDNARAAEAIRRRAQSGVRVRILISKLAEDGITRLWPGEEFPCVELRLNYAILYSSVYRVDDELIIKSAAYGVSASHLPIMRLTNQPDAGLANVYFYSFEQAWGRGMALEAKAPVPNDRPSHPVLDSPI